MTKVKNLATCDGLYPEAEIDLTPELAGRFIELKTEGKTIMVNPEFITSFEVEKTKDAKQPKSAYERFNLSRR